VIGEAVVEKKEEQKEEYVGKLRPGNNGVDAKRATGVINRRMTRDPSSFRPRHATRTR